MPIVPKRLGPSAEFRVSGRTWISGQNSIVAGARSSKIEFRSYFRKQMIESAANPFRILGDFEIAGGGAGSGGG
jgi:hypothetical protein